MASANLINSGKSLTTDNESIVIVDNFQSIRGGRTLDVTGFTPEVIPAGHIVIEETSTGEYKPMPVSADAYGALPVGHTYAGVVVANALTAKPMVGIMVRGTVNPAASAYTISSILTAVKAALPLIDFRED